MLTKRLVIDEDMMDEDNYAFIQGKKYPIRFVGYDKSTYQHKSGCLALNNSQGSCQCGALEKAVRIYGAIVRDK